MDATHDGPPVFLTSQLWSELNASGITQETPRRLQFVEMSDKTLRWGELDVLGPLLARAFLTDRDTDVLDRIRRDPDAAGCRILQAPATSLP